MTAEQPSWAEVIGALHPEVVLDEVGRGEAEFRPRPELRGNPGWLHGGLAATLLDHVCARVASAALGGGRVVTGRLDLRYRHPVPLAEGPYTTWAEPTRRGSRLVTVRGAISGPGGGSLVEASGLFVPKPG